jgi:hypothetical protein
VELSIKIKIPNDQVYRDSLFPYDVQGIDLLGDVRDALDNAISVMRGGGDSAVVDIKHDGTAIGTLKMKAR